jgi:hypothetical protein
VHLAATSPAEAFRSKETALKGSRVDGKGLIGLVWNTAGESTISRISHITRPRTHTRYWIAQVYISCLGDVYISQTCIHSGQPFDGLCGAAGLLVWRLRETLRSTQMSLPCPSLLSSHMAPSRWSPIYPLSTPELSSFTWRSDRLLTSFV